MQRPGRIKVWSWVICFPNFRFPTLLRDPEVEAQKILRSEDARRRVLAIFKHKINIQSSVIK